MKIVQLTPGTGNFHCGGCLRDEALAKALRANGHDVALVPLYLPTVLDRDHKESHGHPTPHKDSNEPPIFFGGVNVYLQQKTKLFRATPRWIDKLFDSRWLLNAAAKKSGMTKAHELGEMTVSMLHGEHGKQVKELDRLTRWLQTESQPDVVCISNALLLGMVGRLKEVLRVPVACTLQGEDGFIDTLPEPWREQAWQQVRKQARLADALIAVSPYYAKEMAKRLELPEHRIDVVENGIDFSDIPSDLTHNSDVAMPLTLGYLARLCEPKGFPMLADAFIELKQNPDLKKLKLLVVGASTASDQPLIQRALKRLEAAGVAHDVELRQNVDRAGKIAALREMSVMSVPAEYGEAFGLYVVEAMACGVPVVQPDHAAFPDLIEATGGGMLYRCGSMDSLVSTLTSLLTSPEQRHALGTSGASAVRDKFSHLNMAHGVASVYQRLLDTNALKHTAAAALSRHEAEETSSSDRALT